VTQDGVGEAIARAQGFVAAHGDALQRARAAALGDPARRDEVSALLPAIESDEAALAALALLDALGVRRGPAVERAVARVAAAQQPDGRFALAGDPVAGTAAVAGLLARTACVRPSVLRAAGDWLAAHWSPERVAGGDAAAIAGWASFFANAEHELSDAGLQWCGRELERGFRTGAIGALAAARVLVACDAPALPGARLAAGELALSLVAAQAADGGFEAGLPERERVEATLDALAAWQRLVTRR
jgi:hypothetical protein